MNDLYASVDIILLNQLEHKKCMKVIEEASLKGQFLQLLVLLPGKELAAHGHLVVRVGPDMVMHESVPVEHKFSLVVVHSWNGRQLPLGHGLQAQRPLGV